MDSVVAASFKIIVLGKSTVGKTALIARLNTGQFELNTVATIGIDFHDHLVNLDNGVQINLQIWDTAGQERFRNVTRSYYRGAHGVVYVYDVTNPESFQDLQYWLDSVKESVANARDDKHEPVSILLGNKIDLKDVKVVDKNQGELVRDRNMLYGFYEVSAKTGENVEKAFKDLAFYLVDNYHNLLLKAPTASQPPSPTSSKQATTPTRPAPKIPTEPQSSNPFATKNNDTVKLSETPTSNVRDKSSECKCL